VLAIIIKRDKVLLGLKAARREIGTNLGLLLIYANIYKAIPLIKDFEFSLLSKITIVLAFTWSSLITIFPEFLYSTMSQNPIARGIRTLFVGSSANITSDEAIQNYNTLMELHKNVMSIRSELKANMKDMMKLAQTGNFQTFYWSRITFDEFTDAITRQDTLTYKDRNILIIMLGLGNILPLIKDIYFLTRITPIFWNKFGWGLLAAAFATIVGNLTIFNAISKLPLKMAFGI
jgi:uncharacterized protein YrrD